MNIIGANFAAASKCFVAVAPIFHKFLFKFYPLYSLNPPFIMILILWLYNFGPTYVTYDTVSYTHLTLPTKA